MGFEKTTEQASKHQNLEQKSVGELLQGMHQEDQLAVQAVGRVLHHIEPLITAVVNQQKKGGRLFYIGAGTSGRLGVLDASECPPTFGTSPEQVIGIIAGGDKALRSSIEHAEGDPHVAAHHHDQDGRHHPHDHQGLDVVLGIPGPAVGRLVDRADHQVERQAQGHRQHHFQRRRKILSERLTNCFEKLIHGFW